ncbi:FAD-binding and (Fe-S)-binding domain-containing protein [Gynurincola endophyticus]|uniref:FAD-binding and (Fe-S)-binding domain-containing protein n=1 Tax=Gynurincola endophyticus TaxID=2479004 RepID=UPI000F8D23B0|nr:FAD-binding and (Fe-S)-binding domain-containing protein [Gynurincola endophyticus]
MTIEQALLQILPANQIKTRFIDLIAYASDAGFYHLVPKAVVQPKSELEIIRLFEVARQLKLPVVFRTGGTSLSGQSITDGILVDLSRYWNKIYIHPNGSAVTVQPGITGGMVNAYLAGYQKKIGPDPSSIAAAMIGGIISNNSSGMCCGVTFNSYHTTQSIRFILPSGNTFNTATATDYSRFEKEEKVLTETLSNLRREITNDSILYNKIRKKYQTKNTVGYSLNAFIDFEHPMDIFAHLLVGAEGTLAFIAEATMTTIPEPAYKATALLFFENIYDACNAIVPLNNSDAKMVELMDRASLRSIENKQGMLPVIKTLPAAASALLIEFQEETESALTSRVNSFLSQSDSLKLLNAPVFTTDAGERALLWEVRKGLFPAVGAVRKSGTTVVLEDIAFPVHLLGDAIIDLQVLFDKYEYHNAIIFGHAKDGNIHFVVTQSFNTTGEISRYEAFMNEVVQLIVKKYDGTIKAEHGTGRNMAPFVEAEWGGKAYEIMKTIKAVTDPLNLLNPGVIINSDAKAHLKNLKSLPTVEHEVDTCIECGYCEPVCPSKDLTLTPRRRIVVRRALAKMPARSKEHRLLLDQYQYDGLDTCAVDGMCATNCPVNINTGDLVKRLRSEQHGIFSKKTASFIAGNFKMTEWIVRAALKTAKAFEVLLGKKAVMNVTKGIRKLIPQFPQWNEYMSAPPPVPVEKKYTGEKVFVYFPACISRTMGGGVNNKPSLIQTVEKVAAKAGYQIKYGENIMGSCCGQIFSSKGFNDAYQQMAHDFIDRLWKVSEEGNIPVVIDVSSCVYTVKNMRSKLSAEYQLKYDQLKIYDVIQFVEKYLLASLPVSKKKNLVVLHPVCSIQKMGLTGSMVKVARHFAEEVVVPKHLNCCGMAGDRGFLFPELTASATTKEAEEVNSCNYEGYYSSTKTCEIAMSESTGHPYEHLLYLIQESI